MARRLPRGKAESADDESLDPLEARQAGACRVHGNVDRSGHMAQRKLVLRPYIQRNRRFRLEALCVPVPAQRPFGLSGGPCHAVVSALRRGVHAAEVGGCVSFRVGLCGNKPNGTRWKRHPNAFSWPLATNGWRQRPQTRSGARSCWTPPRSGALSAMTCSPRKRLVRLRRGPSWPRQVARENFSPPSRPCAPHVRIAQQGLQFLDVGHWLGPGAQFCSPGSVVSHPLLPSLNHALALRSAFHPSLFHGSAGTFRTHSRSTTSG